jgi:hypothetical protein
MGIDELGEALKAFPESVQQGHEPGAIWQPTAGEVAAARNPQRALYGKPQPTVTPSRIVEANRHTAYEPEQDQGNEHDRLHRRDI